MMPKKMTKTIPHMIEAKLVIPEEEKLEGFLFLSE